MAREFHINLEDSSEREIARLLFDLFRECIRGEETLLNHLRLKAEKRKNNSSDVVAQSQGVNQIEEVDQEFFDDGEEDDEENECSDDDQMEE